MIEAIALQIDILDTFNDCLTYIGMKGLTKRVQFCLNKCLPVVDERKQKS